MVFLQPLASTYPGRATADSVQARITDLEPSDVTHSSAAEGRLAKFPRPEADDSGSESDRELDDEELAQNSDSAVGKLALENSPNFATLPLVSQRNDVCETTAEIPYWWRITTQFWVLLLIGRAARKFSSTCKPKKIHPIISPLDTPPPRPPPPLLNSIYCDVCEA